MDRPATRGWHHLVLYVGIAYAVTWAIALPMVTGDLSERWHFAAAIGPTVAALGVASRQDGIGAFLRHILRPHGGRVPWGIAVSPLVLGGAVAIGLSIGGQSLRFRVDGFVIGVLPLVTYSVFEEIGWRGWLLSCLQARWSPLRATAILTLTWGLWHIPMFFYRFEFDSPMLVPGFFVTLFFGAVLLTAVTNAAGGSVVGAIVFHLSNNVVSAIDNEVFLAVYSTLVIVLAIAVIRVTRQQLFFREGEPTTGSGLGEG